MKERKTGREENDRESGKHVTSERTREQMLRCRSPHSSFAVALQVCVYIGRSQGAALWSGGIGLVAKGGTDCWVLLPLNPSSAVFFLWLFFRAAPMAYGRSQV